MKKDMKQEAKMKMLQELRKMTTDMMGGDIKSKMDGMKKVTVAAKDTEGLKEGLQKAEEMVPEVDKMAEESMTEMGSEGEEMEELDMEECSPEELQEKIKELQAKLESIKK